MNHTNELFQSKSLVALEREPKMVPFAKPASSDIESIESPVIDSIHESQIHSPELEVAPRVTRVSPVFELASVSQGSAHQLTFSQHHCSIADGLLKSSVDIAIGLVVSRLDENESLIATHSFQPETNGCLGVSTRFHVELAIGSNPTVLGSTEYASLATASV